MPKNKTVPVGAIAIDEKKLIQAQVVLFKASKEKPRDTLRRKANNIFSEHAFGHSKNRGYTGEVADSDLEQINKEVKAISRAVMRHPSDEVKQQLYHIHEKMKYHFADRSDEGITWLLGGASTMARGGFGDPKEFRDFLKTNPEKLSSSRLITGLESVLTAIGYRMIKAQWAAAPSDPANDLQASDDQVEMQETVMGLMTYNRAQDDFTAEHTVEPVGKNTYKNRWLDDVAAAKDSLSDDIIAAAEDISEASEADTNDLLPQTLTPERKFQKNNDPGQFSWPGAAVEGNVPIRAHVSGTAALTLAAMDAILHSRGKDYSGDTRNDDDLRQLAGALIVPTFLRGDYHSIAETYAGVEHYINERRKKSDSLHPNTPVQPADAFKGALQMMTNACTKDETISNMPPLREAIQIVGASTARLITEHNAQFDAQTTPVRPEK